MASLRVAIIGAGFAGIAAAYRLRAAGAQVTVFERADSVGGVWRDNHYPGAACDVPSFLYSFSFAQKFDWSRKFAPQPEIHRYIQDTVRRLGLDGLIRFGESLDKAAWDAEAGVWRLAFASGATFEADMVVTATGQMSTPHIPTIPGAAQFRGRVFHTSAWDDSVELDGRSVTVVGSGASVVQVVPAIAEVAGRVTVLQRSPGYVLSKDDHAYSAAVSPRVARLQRAISYAQKEWFTPRLTRWPSLLTKQEGAFRRYVQEQVGDPALRQQVLPSDRLGCKRILVSNDWYSALGRDNVELVGSEVGALTEHEVVASDGRRVPTDVLVLGTGFQTRSFLHGVEVIGVDGANLAEVWGDEPQAYLGVSVPEFPNFFVMYGPNSNPAWNSVLTFLEWQADYITLFAKRWLRQGPAAVSVTRAATERFNRALQRRSSRSVWLTGCTNWYTTPSGRNTQNWPGLATAYWWLTRRVRWSDYDVRPRGATLHRREAATALSGEGAAGH
ncbi:flavin-containing monooxygenase [Leifsonia sp. AG29]|uniref:flavin-containing monooxygenase n=1 Tax=Leifsonia sp. AG29 TaxID=2598860 RepID=UPI00131E5C59|nr:NAD(P)/FAD-dependent oxidoreductase [Leifsonia sp. AG29]